MPSLHRLMQSKSSMQRTFSHWNVSKEKCCPLWKLLLASRKDCMWFNKKAFSKGNNNYFNYSIHFWCVLKKEKKKKKRELIFQKGRISKRNYLLKLTLPLQNLFSDRCILRQMVFKIAVSVWWGSRYEVDNRNYTLGI